jgi:hypothetical protein
MRIYSAASFSALFLFGTVALPACDSERQNHFEEKAGQIRPSMSREDVVACWGRQTLSRTIEQTCVANVAFSSTDMIAIQATKPDGKCVSTTKPESSTPRFTSLTAEHSLHSNDRYSSISAAARCLAFRLERNRYAVASVPTV